MALLYINSRGNAWRKHSYTAGNDFEQSPYKYYLRRVLGWKEHDRKGAFKFGRAIEEAVQTYHENMGSGGVESFIERWAVHKDDLTVKYSKVEKDWANLQRCGEEMLRLYAIRQPSLPIPLGAQTVFQGEYFREVFPGDPQYGEIEDSGKLDIVSYVEPSHPMLPKVQWKPEYGVLRPVIGDMKTSGKDYPEEQGMAGFDLQLRRYAWHYLATSKTLDFMTVAFIVFVKKGHGVKKGSSVTLLVDCGDYKAGDEAVVASHESDDSGNEWYAIVRNDYFIEEMDRAQGRRADGKLDTTKAATTRKAEWIAKNTTAVPITDVTRQRLQFNAGIVSKESAEEAGAIAGEQIKAIVNCWKTGKWISKFGIKFPKDDTKDPYFIAFVKKDKAYLQENFIQTDEESMADLFADEPDTEGESE